MNSGMLYVDTDVHNLPFMSNLNKMARDSTTIPLIQKLQKKAIEDHTNIYKNVNANVPHNIRKIQKFEKKFSNLITIDNQEKERISKEKKEDDFQDKLMSDQRQFV